MEKKWKKLRKINIENLDFFGHPLLKVVEMSELIIDWCNIFFVLCTLQCFVGSVKWTKQSCRIENWKGRASHWVAEILSQLTVIWIKDHLTSDFARIFLNSEHECMCSCIGDKNWKLTVYNTLDLNFPKVEILQILMRSPAPGIWSFAKYAFWCSSDEIN